MRSQIKAAWDWLPVIVRAIVLGWVLLMIGSTITFLPLLGNLKFHPEIPWAFPMTVAVLAVYGAYFSGWGPPAGTRLIALCAHLACGNSGNGVRDHCACCAAIALAKPYVGSRPLGLDLAFFLSVANDYWGIAFDRRNRRRRGKSKRGKKIKGVSPHY